MSEHDGEIWAIALPALIALLVDPFLSIVDTGYIGRLGAVSLASLGPCTSIFHLSFNMFRCLAQIVIQAMCMASAMGAGVCVLLRTKGYVLLHAMGAAPGSELARTALPYLRCRALAAPAVLLLMVCEGAFRGAGDTVTPLPVILTIALINLILDPILMFRYNMGMLGAAVATVAAQYIGLFAYMFVLFSGNRRSPITVTHRYRDEEIDNSGRRSPRSDWEKVQKRTSLQRFWRMIQGSMPVFRQLASANVAMLVRNGTLMATWAFATATATRMGTVQVASHQVILSVWLFCALVSEAPGISAQVLAARYHTMRRPDLLRSLTKRLLEIGTAIGCAMGALLIASKGTLPQLFATNTGVQSSVRQLLTIAGLHFPLVAYTLILEGFLVGCGYFGYLAKTAIISNSLCACALGYLSTLPTANVYQIWMAITGLFVGRLIAAAAPLVSKKGPLAVVTE